MINSTPFLANLPQQVYHDSCWTYHQDFHGDPRGKPRGAEYWEGLVPGILSFLFSVCGVYSRTAVVSLPVLTGEAFVQGWCLFDGSIYTRVVFSQGQLLIE